jgi:uncharacterized protein YggE
MTDEVVISVRGEASTTVMPDEARVRAVVRAVESRKADAVRSAGAALDAFRATLATHGGAARDPAAPRTPLSWTASSANTADEVQNLERGRRRPTGRTVARIELWVFVRDFALLTPVASAIADHDAVRLHHIGWSADDDNPGWATVRADAIRVGLRRAGDYAAALGGSLLRIEQVADAGLLDGHRGHEQAIALSGGGGIRRPGNGVKFDPELQRLSAFVDVRVLASVPALGYGARNE